MRKSPRKYDSKEELCSKHCCPFFQPFLLLPEKELKHGFFELPWKAIKGLLRTIR